MQQFRNFNHKTPIAISTLAIILLLPNFCFAQTSCSFTLLDEPDGDISHQLTISITQTLLQYYINKDHNLYRNQDLSKYVTPDPLEPVANNLWEVYSNQEDFANGVLMITHQIPYEESTPQKYPIETIVDNEGDCDLFSFLAASILTAGGIDTVLLLFEQEEHMAIGISLPNEPRDARTNVYYYTYENKRYYIAECTGNFRRGWRVGECPDMVQGSQAVIIPLDNMEITAPSKVSSSYSTQKQSSLVLSVYSKVIIAQNEIKITGTLNPTLAYKNITLYASSLGSQLTKIGTATTDSQGRYIYIWESPTGGLYQIRANWDGDNEYAGSDSNISQLVIIPFLWVAMGAIVLFFLLILIIVSLATRGHKMKKLELEEQED